MEVRCFIFCKCVNVFARNYLPVLRVIDLLFVYCKSVSQSEVSLAHVIKITT